MKKIIKNNMKLFIAFFIGLISSGVTAYAATKCLSSNIMFTASNPNWKVGNVEEALNDLYSMKLSDTYSLEERKIGKWIDGKTIYQKTIDLGTSFTTNGRAWYSVVDVADLNIKQLICSKFMSEEGGNLNYLLSLIVENKLKIFLATSDNINFRYITIQYTKNE